MMKSDIHNSNPSPNISEKILEQITGSNDHINTGII